MRHRFPCAASHLRRLGLTAAGLAVVAVVLAGCATGTVNPILATGEGLRVAARQFNEAAALYDRLYCVGRNLQGDPAKIPGCTDRITEREYRAFATFADRFRPAHRAARTAWRAAALAGDAGGAERAAATLDVLRAELVDFLIGELGP